MTLLSNIKKGIMGTIEFDAHFPGMRKPQNFSVYPIHEGQDATRVTIQSETRIGWINMENGKICMSKPHSSGAYFHHLPEARFLVKLDAEELLLLKGHILGTAHGAAGKAENGFMQTDNSGAINVFGPSA